MKHFFVLTFVFVSLLACNESNTSTATMDPDPEFPLDGLTLLEYPGTNAVQAIRKDGEGKTTEEGTLVNGKRDGAWYTYHPRNGMIKTITDFVEGKLNGIHTEFNDRGQLEVKAYYVNNVLDGPRYKYRFGKVVEDSFYVNGQLDGVYKTYHNNGKLNQESNFKNGVREGKAIYFDDKGIKIMEYEYKNGEIASGGKVDPPSATEPK